MTITGQIIDQQTGAPIPGASITLYDRNGIYLGIGIAAGSDGKFTLTSQKAQGATLHISNVGFRPVMIDAALLAVSPPRLIELQPEATQLDDVTVTPRKGIGLIAWGLIAVSLFFVFSKNKAR